VGGEDKPPWACFGARRGVSLLGIVASSRALTVGIFWRGLVAGAVAAQRRSWRERRG